MEGGMESDNLGPEMKTRPTESIARLTLTHDSSKSFTVVCTGVIFSQGEERSELQGEQQPTLWIRVDHAARFVRLWKHRRMHGRR
jgi:hypothetical protein